MTARPARRARPGRTGEPARRTGRAGLGGVALAAVGLLAGCSLVGGDDVVPLDEALATREEVRDVTQELAAVVVGAGLEPSHANGDWSTCTDDGGSFQYTSAARLDVTDGVALDALPGVLEALAVEAGLDTDGPGAAGNPEVARGTVGDLDVRVRGYGDGPELMLEVLGPCLRIASEDRDGLDAGDVGSQDIPIGGSNQPAEG